MTAVLTEKPAETRLPELTFPAGLAGFPGVERFTLAEVPDAGALFLLRSLDEAGLEFVVAPPALFFPDYAPEVDDDTAARLGITDAADALLLVILTVGESLADTTANLLAPIVINQVTHTAGQVVVQGDWSLRAPLHRP